jgi:hypothetical protein
MFISENLLLSPIEARPGSSFWLEYARTSASFIVHMHTDILFLDHVYQASGLIFHVSRKQRVETATQSKFRAEQQRREKEAARKAAEETKVHICLQ